MAQVAADGGVGRGEGTAAQPREAAGVREAAEILRGIIVAGLSAALVGFIVAGVGGRIVMRLATLASSDSAGNFTENGNRIGDITIGGTLAVILVAGAIATLVGTVFWVAIRPWLPTQRVLRAPVAAALAVAVSGFFLVDSRNLDFFVLQSDLLIAAMLLAIPALVGAGLVVVEPWMDRKVRHPGVRPWTYLAVATSLVLIGAVFAVPGTVGLLFSDGACLCSVAPVPLGVPLASRR
jgi:hypothetical protein